MAKIAIEAVSDVYKIVKNSSLFAELGGRVYAFERPRDTVGEAIVINALPMTSESLQECVLNLNIFVPNMQLMIAGKLDDSQPNLARIAFLSKMVYPLFDDYWADGFSIWIEQEYMLGNSPINEHYNNFRLSFKNNK